MHTVDSLARREQDEQARAVVLLDRARAAITEATTVQDVKQAHDKADAVRIIAKRIEHGEALAVYANEIVLRAKRKMGELLKEMPKQHGGHRSPRGTSEDKVPPSLADLGITKNYSHRCQRLADVPERQFESALRDPETASERALVRATEKNTNGHRPELRPTTEQRLKDAERLLEQLLKAGEETITKPVDPWATAARRANRYLDRNVRGR